MQRVQQGGNRLLQRLELLRLTTPYPVAQIPQGFVQRSDAQGESGAFRRRMKVVQDRICQVLLSQLAERFHQDAEVTVQPTAPLFLRGA